MVKTSDAFIKKLRFLPLTHCQDLIKEVQKHLHKDPKNTKWLSCLGFLAFADQHIELAAKAYSSLFHQEGAHYDEKDAVIYAQVLMAKSEQKQAYL